MDRETWQVVGIALVIAVLVYPLAFTIRRRRIAAGIDPVTGNRQTALVSTLLTRALPLCGVGIVLLYLSATEAKAEMKVYAYLVSFLMLGIGVWSTGKTVRAFRRLSAEAYARTKQASKTER